MADLSLPRQNGAIPSVICESCGAERVVVTDYGSWFVSAHDHDAPAEPDADETAEPEPTEETP